VRKFIYVLLFTIIQSIILFNTHPNYLTLIGTLAGVLSVTTLVFRNPITFIFSMISNGAFLVIGVQHGVFSEMIQQPMYFVLSIIGLNTWLYNRKNRLVDFLASAKVRNIIIVSVVFILVWGVISYNLGSKVFVRDALLGGIALASQSLEIGKNRFSWVGWILLNTISISTWISVGNIAMAAMYTLYLINSVYGLIYWNFRLHVQNSRVSENMDFPR